MQIIVGSVTTGGVDAFCETVAARAYRDMTARYT